MSFRKILLTIFILLIAVVSFWIGRASMEPRGMVPLKALPDSYRQAILTSYPWLQKAQEFHIANYSIYVPKKQTNDELLISYGNKIISVDRHNVTLGLDTDKNGVVVLTDDKHNGIFNSLSYDYFDNTGHLIGTAYDWNRVGQPDIKTVYKTKETYVWLLDKWRSLIKKDGVAGVEIDGIWKKVKKVDSRYVLE